MKNVIVTGATGMIGATLIDLLIKDKINVVAVVRPQSKKMINIQRSHYVTIIECDLNDILTLKEKISGEFDTFYHFAWDGTYGESRNNLFLQEGNILNTLKAVDVAHYFECDTFVGAGSQAEFGNVYDIISDDLPKNPVTGYGIAKYTANKLSKLLCEQYHMRQSWGRIISTYGPKDNQYTMVMSSVLKMLNGERVSFTKGEQIWDYIYSEDCARAFYLIGQYGKHGIAYTIGSGNSKTLKEYILTIRDTVNPNLEIGLGELEYYPNQVMRLTSNIDQLTNDTGFVPKVDFKEGIKRTIAWCKERDK